MIIDKIEYSRSNSTSYIHLEKDNEVFNSVLVEEIKKQENNTYTRNYGNMNISFRVGECNVKKSDWENDSFPFWKYFEKNTKVEEVNTWKSKPIQMTEKDIQKSLNKIEFGEMVVIIPEELEERMARDSSFANNVYKNIATWKNNYDKTDNAIAAQMGIDVSIYQYTKSYCITLDENGYVDKHVVVSGGIDCFTDSKKKEISMNTGINKLLSMHLHIQQTEHEKELSDKELVTNEQDNDYYIEAMSVLASSFQKRN